MQQARGVEYLSTVFLREQRIYTKYIMQYYPGVVIRRTVGRTWDHKFPKK